MIKKILNPIYLVAILAGFFLWKYSMEYQQESLLFFGFAENKETEINLNHPVEVNSILVTTGQYVKEGQNLLEVSHIEFEEDIEQELNKIEELQIKEKLWQSEKKGAIEVIAARQQLELQDIQTKINALQSEQSYNTSLLEGLKTVDKTDFSEVGTDIKAKIQALQSEKALLKQTLEKEIAFHQDVLDRGNNPYRQQIKTIQDKIGRKKSKIEKLTIPAPTDGLIGNIHVKEAEHITSFKTMITFYEPNPTLVKGYVHESMIVLVNAGDSLWVKSTKNPDLFCKGVVSGLGSRIIEIPERLRKIPELKTYGREVLITIPKDNDFLQKEKVKLELSEDLRVSNTSSKSNNSKLVKKH